MIEAMIEKGLEFIGLFFLIVVQAVLWESGWAIPQDRDILLTPNKSGLAPGKALFFDGFDNGEGQSGREGLSWIEPLKYALYLVLNGRVDGNSNGR